MKLKLINELENIKWRWWTDRFSQYKQTSKWYKTMKNQIMNKLIEEVGSEQAKLIDNEITYKLMRRFTGNG